MSDNWNPPPEREPADGDQPAGPPEQSAGDGQSPRWWSESTDAKREFQDPSAAQGERPANNWFGEGWSNRRPEDPDQGPAWQTRPDQSRPQHSGGPTQGGPTQGGPTHSGPAQSGPAQSGPAQSGPAQSGGPAQGGGRQVGWQSAPAYDSTPQPPQTGPAQATSPNTGPDRGPQSTGPQSTRPQPSAPQSSGPQTGGPQSTGPQSRGPQPPRPQGSGAQPGGPQSAGQQTGGPQSSRPQSSGPQSGGPQSGGASQPGGPWAGGPQGGWPQGGMPPAGDQGRGPQGGGGTGPSSESSYLWAPSPQPTQQPPSPWSNALPPNKQQSGPRHAAQRGQQNPGYNQGAGNQLGPMGQPVHQAPTWQYPPIPIPQPPGPGRRRKQTRARGLLIGLVVLAVLVVGSGVTLLVRMTGDDAPQTTNSPSTAPSDSPSESPSASPSVTPTQPAPAEDEVLTANKLYSVGPIAASKCAEPPFAPINFTAARNYYNRLLPCLNRTWSLAMKKAGLGFRSPKAVVYVGKLPSPCGMQRSVRAAYCGANATIYLPFAVDNRYYRNNPVYARAIMLNTFAHEYGHHVQNLSGILTASVERQQSMTPNQKLLESRRRELQATCLGAAYLGANAAFIPMRNPLLANWKFLIAHTGDDYSRPRVHDHGNRVSNYLWSLAGYNSKQPNSCNTYTADESRVA